MKKKLFVILGIVAAMDLTDILTKGHLLGSLEMIETDKLVENFRESARTKVRGKMILKVAEFWKDFYQNR